MSGAEDMEEMLRGVKNIVSSKWGIQRWNVSNAKSMKALFMDTSWVDEYANLGSWDVSKVEDMGQLFRWSNLADANISMWDVSNVFTFSG